MAKFILNNVKMVGSSGGSVHNYTHVEITDSILDFYDSGIDFKIDDTVAVIEQIVQAGYKQQLCDVIVAMRNQEPAKQEEIVKESFLKKMSSKVKDLRPFIDILLKWGETYIP